MCGGARKASIRPVYGSANNLIQIPHSTLVRPIRNYGFEGNNERIFPDAVNYRLFLALYDSSEECARR